MTNRRLPRSVACAAVFLAAACGCQALHRYRPTPVLVRDADTGKPIPGAEVHISYPLAPVNLAPAPSAATTAGDGVARLRAAPYGEAGVQVSATAAGYLDEEKTLPVSDIEAIQPASLFEKAERRPARVVVEMYAGPQPTVELVVPLGYRGEIRAELCVQENAPRTPGQRSFSAVVQPGGVVRVSGPPLLWRISGPDFRGRFTDGAPISRDAQGADVGLWWLGNDGDVHHLLVGTRQEFDNRRAADLGSGDAPRPGGRRGGGRGGRRGGRGGQPPATPPEGT
jgi:hypothetical protein